jgi:hypothetical protein
VRDFLPREALLGQNVQPQQASGAASARRCFGDTGAFTPPRSPGIYPHQDQLDCSIGSRPPHRQSLRWGQAAGTSATARLAVALAVDLAVRNPLKNLWLRPLPPLHRQSAAVGTGGWHQRHRQVDRHLAVALAVVLAVRKLLETRCLRPRLPLHRSVHRQSGGGLGGPQPVGKQVLASSTPAFVCKALAGRKPTSNTTTVNVTLPRQQMMTEESLCRLLERASRKEPL